MKDVTLFITSSNLSRYQSMSSRIWYISRALNSHGISTKIIGRKSEDDSLNDDNVIAIKHLSTGFLGELFFIIRLYLCILQTVYREKICNIILRGYDLIFIAFLLRIIGKKVIYDFHGYRYEEQILEGRFIRAKITKIFDFLILLAPNKIISVSKGVSKQLPKNYKRENEIILQNGVDLDLFNKNEIEGFESEIFEKYNLKKYKKIVGFIGMWTPTDNIKDILDASIYCDDIQFLIVGNGYNFNKLVELTRNNSSIIWTGKVDHDESIRLLKLIDICITPYSKDKFFADKPEYCEARKNKEYIAAGKPIIMSDIIGREKYLNNNNNVLLYESGNPKDLSNKIKLLLNNESLYKKIQENNKILSKEFGWDELVEKSGLVSILKNMD